MSDPKRYVLIVDDEEFFRDLLLRRLILDLGEGYDVLLATDGYEALEFMRSKPIAVAVLDLRMNNLDGLAVCRQAHDDGLLDKIPVIISSGFISEDDHAELESLGVRHFLHKPYAVDKLLSLLKKICPPSGDSASGDPNTSLG